MKKWFRPLLVIIGVILIGNGIGLMRLASLGVDPCSSMVLGIVSILKLNSMGNITLSVNLVLLFVVLAAKRRDLLGFGTIFNMVFCGYTADFTLWLLRPILPEVLTMWMRVVAMILGIIVICVGVALYMRPEMGIAPYDGMAYVIESTTRNKIPFKIARIITDVICVAVAVVLGLMTGNLLGILGIGTLIMATSTGPLVQFFIDHVADPLLDRFGEEKKPARKKEKARNEELKHEYA